MDEIEDEVPTYFGGRSNGQTLTIWVSKELKARYDRLRRTHDIRVAECMRRAMLKELERLEALVEEAG